MSVSPFTPSAKSSVVRRVPCTGGPLELRCRSSYSCVRRYLGHQAVTGHEIQNRGQGNREIALRFPWACSQGRGAVGKSQESGIEQPREDENHHAVVQAGVGTGIKRTVCAAGTTRDTATAIDPT